MSSSVFFDWIPVCDEKVFTLERCEKWIEQLTFVAETVAGEVMARVDNSSSLYWSVNSALVDEVIHDAVIGMRKIQVSDNNKIDDPASFKEAAYLAYWWLRHKPVSVCSADSMIGFDNIHLINEAAFSGKELGEAKMQVSWQLCHINELVAVHFVRNYLFNLDKVVCGKKQCDYCSQNNEYDLGFSSFEEMDEMFTDKLLYYFCYRAIAPKIIVQILEAYACHPVYAQSGSHWSLADKECSE